MYSINIYKHVSCCIHITSVRMTMTRRILRFHVSDAGANILRNQSQSRGGPLPWSCKKVDNTTKLNLNRISKCYMSRPGRLQACGRREMRSVHVAKFEGTRPRGRLGRKWENNTKILNKLNANT
jgi:hypothetical protein